jgi:hypothetical protein
MKKLFEKIFERVALNLVLMFGIAILDLIGLGSKDGRGIGLGFIVAFLYFVGFIIYNMTKKDGKEGSI